jgi:hypothetical protein
VTSTRYSPWPIVVTGKPEPCSWPLMLTSLPGAKGWYELYNDAPDDYAPPNEGLAGILLDEFDIEIGAKDHRITMVAARINSRSWDRGSPPPGIPTSGEPVEVRLAVDYEPERGVVTAYENKFPMRLATDDGLYAGPVDSDTVTNWVYSSSAFWLGSDEGGSLKALYFPVRPQWTAKARDTRWGLSKYLNTITRHLGSSSG